MALIDEVKVAIRTTSDDAGLTQEAQTLIDAAKADLRSSGVQEAKITEDDALIRQCVIFYVKGFYGYDNADAASFQNAYADLKNALCSKAEYTAAPDPEPDPEDGAEESG